MNRFIIINELVEKRALKSSCSSPVCSPSPCNLLGSYILVGLCILARTDGCGAELASQRKQTLTYMPVVFSVKELKLFGVLLENCSFLREKGFHQYTSAVPDLVVDFCNFLMQTFWKFAKQKPGKFLNCWFQTQEYSQGKDHSVIAMVFIHFPQTSVTGHCQEQVILLQTFSLTQDDSFYVLINSLNPTSPTTPINPLTSFLALTCQNPRSESTTKKMFLSLAAESSFKSNTVYWVYHSFFFKPCLICCYCPSWIQSIMWKERWLKPRVKGKMVLIPSAEEHREVCIIPQYLLVLFLWCHHCTIQQRIISSFFSSFFFFSENKEASYFSACQTHVPKTGKRTCS